MKRQEGTFKGIRNLNIYYQFWLPEGEIKGVLVVVHGLAEHSGRYMNIVNHFVPLGYAIYAFDHIGHGKSEGTRVHVERFEVYIRSVKTFVDMVRQWQPDKPICIIGHSMGGLITARYLLDHQADVSAAVLSAPGIRVPDNVSSVTLTVSRILSFLMPTFGMLQLEAEGISRDPEIVKAYIHDPLVFRGKISARLGAEMLVAMKRVSKDAGKITLPILILQGSADRLVHPTGAQMLFDRVGSETKDLKFYHGFYHEVFNEPDKDRARVINDVEVWLRTNLKSGSVDSSSAGSSYAM